MKLIPDWKQAHRFWSMRWAIVNTFVASVEAAYLVLPDNWLPAIPDGVKVGLALATLFTAGATGVARVLKQPNLSDGG